MVKSYRKDTGLDDDISLKKQEKERQKALRQEARRQMLIALRLKKDDGRERISQKKPLPQNLKEHVTKLIAEIKRHKNAFWILYYVFAVASDIFDLIPLLGIVFAIFLKPILFVLLWRHRRGATGRVLALIGIDLIPFISIIPASFLTVLVTELHSKAKAKKAKKILRKYNKKYILPPEAFDVA